MSIQISTMNEMNLDDSVLCGILVLKRYPSENAQNELAVATVEAVLLGSFMLAPLLQFPSTLLEALQKTCQLKQPTFSVSNFL